MFDPHSTKYTYPEYTDQHYLKVNDIHPCVFDENYPYFDRSKSFRFKQFWARLLLNVIVFPMCRPYMGLIIKNRKNLKRYKKELKDGDLDTISVQKTPQNQNIFEIDETDEDDDNPTSGINIDFD